jgi:hypothetical protein
MNHEEAKPGRMSLRGGREKPSGACAKTREARSPQKESRAATRAILIRLMCIANRSDTRSPMQVCVIGRIIGDRVSD